MAPKKTNGTEGAGGSAKPRERLQPALTFQDLIKSPFDETQFEFYATTQLVKNVPAAQKQGLAHRLSTAA